MTGGRLLRAKRHIGDDDFCFTYGDGVADVDVRNLIAAHNSRGRSLTLTAVQPPARYGTLSIGDDPRRLQEKPEGDRRLGQRRLLRRLAAVLDYIDGDDTVFERAPLEGSPQRRAGGVPAPRLLARHGHAVGQDLSK